MKTTNLKKSLMTFMLSIMTIAATNAMIPGPSYVYECTKCSNLLQKGSILSGNTFGSTLYSDGKRISPMLPEFPELTKCPKCDTILWLSDMKELGTFVSWDKHANAKWGKADRVEFLDVADLARFLELDTVKNDREKERIIRHRIWWAFNDRLRDGKEIFARN